ncbi:MAG: hypothetical protein ABI837_01155 [Acidobacteriota bacterium]
MRGPRLRVTAALLLFAVSVAPVRAQRLTPDDVDRWRADLRYLAREMEARHKNLYHSISRADFAAAVETLDRTIPSLQRHQIIVEMMRLAARVGDGHTNISPTRDAKIGFHTLPVRMYFFDDGLFIRAAARDQAGLAGTRITKIGGVPIDEAYRRVRELIGRDNEMGARHFAPMFLAMPEILHALELSDSIESAELTVVDKMGERQVRLPAHGLFEPMPADTDTSWEIPEGWIDARQVDGSTTALWLENPREIFRMKMLPSASTLYVQLNKVGDAPAETLLAFAERLRSTFLSSGARRLVLDLRLNRGGNGGLLKPLLKAIIRTEAFEERGRFFVLIGRSTFSAAQFLVDDLQTYSNPVFIGEPTGSKPVSYGDSRKIVLPDSGITVRASIYYWQRNPWEEAVEWIPPDVAAPLRFEDYRHNVDPALEAALHFQPEDPLRRVIAAAMLAGGRENAMKTLHAWDAEVRHRYVDHDKELILAGYELVQANRSDLALDAVGPFHQQRIARRLTGGAHHPRSKRRKAQVRAVWSSQAEAFDPRLSSRSPPRGCDDREVLSREKVNDHAIISAASLSAVDPIMESSRLHRFLHNRVALPVFTTCLSKT